MNFLKNKNTAISREFIFFMILFLMIISASSIRGDHSQTIVEDAKFTISGTVKDEFNKGRFPIDKGISGVFEFEIEEPEEQNYSMLFIKSTGEEYLCASHNLSNSNTTINDRCTVYVNDTGIYTWVLRIDNRNIYIETLEVTDASLSALFWVLITLTLLCILVGFIYLKDLFILALLFGVGSVLNILFNYKYVLSDDLFTGLIGLIIFGLIVLILFIFKYYISE